MAAICTMSMCGAEAQTLNFTNEMNHTTGPQVDRDLFKDRPDTVHFPAGSAVWAVLWVRPAGFADINAFSGRPQGGGALRKVVEMANRSGGWDLVVSKLGDVSAELGPKQSLVSTIIPDKPDGSQSFNQLLDMIAAHKGNSPILMRVKFENGEDPSQFTQNGFYLDVTDGLGRYGEWIAQRTAATNAAHADYEQEHLKPRSEFVKGFRSRRTDPKFVADVHKWWSDKVGSALLSTKVCSDDYNVFRNNFGVVLEKQLCALITYKSGNQCFAMVRRFSYRRMGSDSFENEVVDSTYAEQRMPADGDESFFGGHPYEITCGAAR